VTDRYLDLRGSLLRRGDTGPRVAGLRSLLTTIGIWASSNCPPDVFDGGLEQGVRAFQQRRGLVADGIVGPQTAQVLEGARWKLGDRALVCTPGHLMRGDDVAALQERLVVLGLFAGPVDGIFGPQTEAALQELQRGLGLAPDGMCGPTTLHGMSALARAVGGGDPWALRQQAAVAVAGSSLAGKILVIDPGHGGSDRGIQAGPLVEAEVVLDVARRMERRLTASGVVAVLTRTADVDVDETARIERANAVAADLVMSLHCDAHPCASANGVASFYWGDVRVGARSAVGAQLAQLVQSEVVARTGLVDLRTHACTIDLVRLTRMPTVQVELGYLSSPHDVSRLADPAFRDAAAEALVIAVQRLYLGDDDAETGTLQLNDVLSFAGIRS
jgi:N-acetylmuramoyl-L-alanine amidase